MVSFKIMTKEEQQLERRLLDLAETAYQRGIVTYSDFLNLNEQNIFLNIKSKLSYLKTESFGGYEAAERQMAAFVPDAPIFCIKYPIACVRIEPLQKKFAESLSHRDYLGALLNLGLDRAKTGDILVEEQQAFLFCQEKLADFICENLHRIRHTSVMVQRVEEQSFSYEPKIKEIKGTMASVRLDSLLSLAFGASRSSLTEQIEGGKVFVNGRLVTSNGYQPKIGDLVSVRGMGRFRFQGIGGQSKKGRSYVTLLKYI